MPTYLQLASEPVWNAQHTTDVMTAVLLDPLRVHYNRGPASIGAAGDNQHLYGRHRSRSWCLNSIYCTDRSYGTQDGRDQVGDGNWYRACDIGITGAELQAASRRMDALVRSGGAPGVAEWFGTFDGHNVVGWFEGHPSSSDDSHLWHLHVGFWTGFAADEATMRAVYGAVTGTTPAPAKSRRLFAATLEDEMPYALGKHENDARVFALFTSGLIRHIGPGEFELYGAGRDEPGAVPLIVSKDGDELNRWVATASQLLG